MAQQNRAATQQKEKVDNKKGNKKNRRIGLVILLIVVLILGYVAFTYGSLPYAILTAKNRSAGTLASIMLSKLNSAKAASIDYNGSITVNNSDPKVVFSYNKHGNVTYLLLSILHNYNGSFVVINATLTNLTQPGMICTLYYNQNRQFNGPNCVWAKPYKPFLNVTDQIAELQTLDNVSIKSFGLNSYNGQPCYNINGTATLMVNGTLVGEPGYVPAFLNFSGCLSAQYNIPLYIKGYAKTQNGASVVFSFGSYNFVYDVNAHYS